MTDHEYETQNFKQVGFTRDKNDVQPVKAKEKSWTRASLCITPSKVYE